MLLLSIARNQLKASYLMSSEVQSTVAEDIGMQVCVGDVAQVYNLCCYRILHHSLTLQAAAKGSYTPLVDTLKQVDSAYLKTMLLRYANNIEDSE